MERPPPARGGTGDDRFERSVTYRGSEREITRRIDLYGAGCFVLGSKQGANTAPPRALFPGEAATARRLEAVQENLAAFGEALRGEAG